ncbi:hypothetical protein TRAPUB_12741 [Trametes pubescens]|uniref:Uncharacterized protein n=1 Tax=Trametes pubescens TaxID=154538 RepID=A0A1M2VT95_TRAPU|nr:hypothetical protein TRAPUB_12741 [Trametes pubescens]
MESSPDQYGSHIPRTFRDIGLELVRQLVQSPWNLFIATSRQPDKATVLVDLKSSAKGTQHIIPLDVSSFGDIRALPQQLWRVLGEAGLDYLRDKATALVDPKKTAKGTLHIVQVDLSDFDDIRKLPKQLEPILGEIGLDYLVNKAATIALDQDALLDILRTNTAAPALVSQVVLSFFEKGCAKKILHVSSYGRSIVSLSSG